jgi:hypothetical protein
MSNTPFIKKIALTDLEAAIAELLQTQIGCTHAAVNINNIKITTHTHRDGETVEAVLTMTLGNDGDDDALPF